MAYMSEGVSTLSPTIFTLQQKAEPRLPSTALCIMFTCSIKVRQVHDRLLGCLLVLLRLLLVRVARCLPSLHTRP